MHYIFLLLFANFRSRWNQNEYTFGSYTYIQTGSSTNDVKLLRKPLVYYFINVKINDKFFKMDF